MFTEFECPNCCKKYKKRGNLTRHLRMSFDCSVGEPWQCMHCQRYFNCKRNLENHVRQRHAYNCNPDVAIRLIQVRGPDHLLGLAPERGEIFPDAEILTKRNEHQEINRVLENKNDDGNLLVLIIDRNRPVFSNLNASQRSEIAVSQLNERSDAMQQVDLNQNNLSQLNKRSFSQIQETQKDIIPVNEINQHYPVTSKSHRTQEIILENHVNVTQVTNLTQEYKVPTIVENERIQDYSQDEIQNSEIIMVSLTEESERSQDYYKAENPPSKILEDNIICNRTLSIPNKVSGSQVSNLGKTTSVQSENEGIETNVRNEEPHNSKRLRLSIIKHQSNNVPSQSIIQLSEKDIKDQESVRSKEFLIFSQLVNEDEIDEADDVPRESQIMNGNSSQLCDQSENTSFSQQSSTIYNPLSQSLIDDICVLDDDLNIFRTVLLRNDRKYNINVEVFLKRLTTTFFDIIEDSLKQHDKLKLYFELIVDIALCDENDIFVSYTQSLQTNFADHHLGEDIYLFINTVYKSILHRLELDLLPDSAIIEIKHLEVNIAHHMPQISVTKNLF